MTSDADLERDQWARFAQNDPDAQAELFVTYRALVERIALRLKRRLPAHIRLDDLRAAGNVGLWQAMRSYQSTSGTPFAAFAQVRIRGAMIDEMRRMDDFTRSQRLQWRQAHAAYGVQQSLPSQVSLEDEGRHEWLVDDSAVTPEQAVLRAGDISELNGALARLSQQQQLILAMVFMEGLTLSETAEVLSLSRSRISAVYSDALKSLRGSLMRQNRQK